MIDPWDSFIINFENRNVHVLYPTLNNSSRTKNVIHVTELLENLCSRLENVESKCNGMITMFKKDILSSCLIPDLWDIIISYIPDHPILGKIEPFNANDVWQKKLHEYNKQKEKERQEEREYGIGFWLKQNK